MADDAQAPEGGQRKENKMKFDRDFILRHADVIRGGEFAFQMRGIPVGGGDRFLIAVDFREPGADDMRLTE